jgi:ESX secretion-associated protein EspB
MTQPQTLNVEYSELIARADELEQSLPAMPLTNPQAPCALSMARHAVKQLALNADMIRLYLNGCGREWKTLAKSLRTAAKAYEEVDEGAADAIDNEGDATAGAAALATSGDADMPFDPPSPLVMAPIEDAYHDLREAATAIASGDEGAACRAFGDQWDDFQRALQGLTYRFRPFTAWEGDARTAVEQNFEQQRQWLFSMVEMCAQLRDQAWQLADAQEKIWAPTGYADMAQDGKSYLTPDQHPGVKEVATCDAWYAEGVRDDSDMKVVALDWYALMQVQSETSLKIFATNTALNPLNPSMFPTASGVGAVIDGGNSRNLPDMPPLDGGTDMSAGTGMPSMPTMPNMPTQSTDSAAAAQAAAAGAAKPKGPGMKPASLGGGIGGGVPAMPAAKAGLGDWSSAQAQTSAAAAGPGRAVPAAYAALGAAGNGAGGAGGGMPMGGGQGKGEGSKGKRVQGCEDEALYTERRAWTEGIIGRRAKAPSDREGVKKPAAYASLDAK